MAESVYTVIYTETDKVRNEALNVRELLQGLICFGASMLGADLGRQLADALLKPFTLTTGASEEVVRKHENKPKIQSIIDKVNRIIGDVYTKAHKSPLVVVDGLDKLVELEQAEPIFLESRALTSLFCHTIYTVPMPIFNSLAFGQVNEESKSYLLPNIKLYEEISGEKYGAGYQKMREIVTKRLQSEKLSIRDIFEPEVIDLLIFKSGGVIRWLIWLIRDASNYAELMNQDKINMEAAQQAVDDRAALFDGRLTTKDIDELKRVRREKRPSGNEISNELLHGLLITAYRNRSTWYDAHPIIWDRLLTGK